MRRVLWLLASAAIACAPLGAQDATTYLPLLEDVVPEAPGLLEAFELAQDPEERMAALDALCRLAASREAGSALIARSEGVLRGLRAYVRDSLARSSAEERALFAEYQQRLVPALEQQGERMLLRRSPAAPAAAPAWRARVERAFEEGDVAGACGWLEAARGWGHAPEGAAVEVCDAWAHAQATGELAAVGSHVPPAWSASVRAWAERPALPELPRRDPELLSNTYLRGGDWLEHSPSVPLVTPTRVLISTGSAVYRTSHTGTLLGQFPPRPDGAAPPPAEATRLRAELTRHGDLVFAPLALERWLAPAREPGPADSQDLALGGYYHCLVGLDPDTLRVLWWDGDPGPQSAPQPLAADPEVEARLRAGHVIACTSDGARLYVALLTKGSELSLDLFAYRTTSRVGAPVALEPAWEGPVRVVQVERGGSEDQAVRPEVAARLVVDGCGRLIVTTDVGVVACAAAASGDLEWVVEREAEADETEFRRWGMRKEAPTPAPPVSAVIVPDPERAEQGGIAVAYAGPALLGIRLRDGTPLWSYPRGKPPSRLEFLLPGEGSGVLAYGANLAVGLDATTGRNLHPQGRPLNLGRFRFCGEGAPVAGGYVLPVRHQNGGGLSLHRLAWRRLPAGGRSVLFDGSHRLPLDQPANLVVEGDHVVAVGATRLIVVSFAGAGGD